MSLINSPFFLASAGTTVEEGQSLRFDDGDSSYLTRTPASAGNRRTWTWSGWVKRGNLSINNYLFEGGSADTDTNRLFFRFNTDDKISVQTATSILLKTAQVFRDVSAYYHLVFVCDTTSATADDRMKIYVNGVQVSSFDTRNNRSQNDELGINLAANHSVGFSHIDSAGYLDGYLANVCFIDGTALDPTSFGEYDGTLWKPKSDADIQSLTFGTNGFYLPFAGDIAAGSSYYFDGSSDYVSYSSTSLYDVGSSDDFELECFFNTDMVSGSGDYGYMLGNYDGSSQFMTLQPDFRSANEHFAWYTGNGAAWGWDYTSGDIKPNTWHHLTISRTSGTLRMFLDGVRLTSIQSFSTSAGTISGGNVINNTTSYNLSSFRIGQAFAGQKAYKGYVSNVRFIVGSSIRNSDSNFTPPTSTLTDVTNTKLLTATNLTIGDDISSNNNDGSAGGNARSSGVNPFGTYNFFDDVSGNDNNWGPNNLQYTDVVLDGPYNGGNFAVMNPLNWNVMTFEEGNLKITTTTNNRSVHSTFAIPSTGKWIYEFVATNYTSGGGAYIGFSNNINEGDSEFTGDHGVYYQTYNGGFNVEGTVSTATGYTVQSTNFTSDGDIHTIAIDMDNQKLYFAKNGTWRNSADPAAGTGGLDISSCFTSPETDFHACITRGGSYNETYTFNFGQDSSFAGQKTPQGNTDDNGVGDFYYSVPSGFLALTTGNLPTPDITAPDEYFNTVTYTGTGTTNSITGVGFQPDWVWGKQRNGANSHELYDAVRGVNKIIYSDLTDAEGTNANGISSFDSDGFTVAGNTSINGSGNSVVAWNWLAGNGTVSNTDGSITSTVSANQTAGFSIVSWNASSTSATIGHGLDKAPEMIIQKTRDSSINWVVQHVGLGNMTTKHLYLNGTNSVITGTAWSAPTSTTFGTSSSTVKSGDDYIAYCFHSVEGYSKIGSYRGNGSSNGPFIHCGFEPAYLLVKRTDASDDWTVYDNVRSPFNQRDDIFYANANYAESTNDTSHAIDFLSNGFKCRGTSGQENSNGGSYIFYAVAEAPFKLANAK